MAGYVSRERGSLMGFLIASPISIGGLFVLGRAFFFKQIGGALSEYIMVFVFSIAMIALPCLGGNLGQSLFAKKKRRPL
jgi:hypothetical protein